MARIRTIKPEFFSSSQVVRCSVNARMLFVGLWCFADDQGVHPDDPHRLKMEVFPGDSFAVDDVQRMLDELIEVNLVQPFAADGASWLGIPSWKRHQRIDKPTFKHPAPPAEFDERSSSPRRDVVEHSSSPRPRIGREGIGEEGIQNGMDKEPPHPLEGGTGLPDGSADVQPRTKAKRPPRATTPKPPPFDPSLVPIPERLRVPAFLDAWRDWIAARQEKRKPLTKRAVDEQLKQLAEVGSDAAVKAIRTSIANDWQGVFPEQAGTAGKPTMTLATTKAFVERGTR